MTMDIKTADNILLDMRDDHKALLLDILRESIPQLEVWAFGSRAKWTARETSDLDLVLRNSPEPENPIGTETLSGLKEIFDESALPFMVDILDWTAVSEKFRKVIEREYMVVQSPGKKGWKSYPLPTQTLSAILSVLDEKIELNRQTNITLEAIAQAIFKEWFVDFNFPVEFPQPLSVL